MRIYNRKDIEISGFKLTIKQDPDPPDPREWDCLGTIIGLKNTRYTIADETVSNDEMSERMHDPNFITLPVFVLDHSGLIVRTSSFNDRWDSWQIGIIQAEKGSENLSDEQIEKVLQGEIETLNDYVQGNVFAYEITKDGQHVDSCYGFYGEDYCFETGLESLAYHLAEYNVSRIETKRILCDADAYLRLAS